jgi:hypothetical protein
MPPTRSGFQRQSSTPLSISTGVGRFSLLWQSKCRYITNPIYRAVARLIRFWGGQIRALICMFGSVIEVRREVVGMTVEPRQRAHRMRLALRRVARRICSVEHARFDQRSRRTSDRWAERSVDIGIAVVTRDAIGAIDDFAALDRAQFARLGARHDDRRDRDPHQRGTRQAERAGARALQDARRLNPIEPRDKNSESACNRVAAVTASAQALQSR